MVILLIIGALMFVSAVLAIAAGMMSSRLSRQEGWVETYESEPTALGETLPQTFE